MDYSLNLSVASFTDKTQHEPLGLDLSMSFLFWFNTPQSDGGPFL